MDTTSSDERFLRRALELASLGPAVDANPRVGCVLTLGDEILAEGWHQGAGTPHAEAAALAIAGDRASGATAYVTLEPCSHTGRTGPCATALINAGVTRVVHAQSDPNPAARGGGDVLREAGINVTGGLLEQEATKLNKDWTFAVTRGRPFVTWKFAATLDGRSAAADGSSRWITGEQARADVHHLRAGAGAVLAGTGTVLADDPQLTVRLAEPAEATSMNAPLRVVVGNREVPASARVFDDAACTIQVRTHDPAEVLAHLHKREIRHVFLEGGPTLASVFLRAGLVDEIVAYLATALLGSGSPAVGDLGITNIADIARFELHDVTRLGDDVRLRLRLRHPRSDTASTKEI